VRQQTPRKAGGWSLAAALEAREGWREGTPGGTAPTTSAASRTRETAIWRLVKVSTTTYFQGTSFCLLPTLGFQQDIPPTTPCHKSWFTVYHHHQCNAATRNHTFSNRIDTDTGIEKKNSNSSAKPLKNV